MARVKARSSVYGDADLGVWHVEVWVRRWRRWKLVDVHTAPTQADADDWLSLRMRLLKVIGK